MARRSGNNKNNSTARIGFEAKLWLAADKLRSNMDAAEYKHVVLGLIFLKYISDSFEEKHTQLTKEPGADPEDPDEYKAENVFWVPPAARWTYLQNSAKQSTIGKIVDDAMVAIERDNQRLKGVLPKDYARPALDKTRLGELIDLIGTIVLIRSSAGADVAKAELPAAVGEGEAKGDIRRAIIEADLVDCMVSLPGQLFYSTQIPVCLWFLSRNKHNGRFRDRRRHTLFIDVRRMGTLTDRTHRELNDGDITKIVSAYHTWKGEQTS